jgi:hypothetical protein
MQRTDIEVHNVGFLFYKTSFDFQIRHFDNKSITIIKGQILIFKLHDKSTGMYIEIYCYGLLTFNIKLLKIFWVFIFIYLLIFHFSIPFSGLKRVQCR